jgi:putative protease
LDKSRPRRLIRVEFALAESADGFTLRATDEDGVGVEFTLDTEKVAAGNRERAIETITSQLTKTGGSGFECSSVHIETETAPFLPMSKLNELRRGVLDELKAARERQRPREVGEIVKNEAPFPENRLDYHGNVLNLRAEAFYKRHGVESIESAAESGRDLVGKRVMTTRYCLRHEMGACPKSDKSAKASPLCLTGGEGDRLELRFDCARCEMQVFLVRRGWTGRGNEK